MCRYLKDSNNIIAVVLINIQHVVFFKSRFHFFTLSVAVAINACDPKSDVFLFTDASAKDYTRLNEVVDAAVAKQITIWPVLTGSCSKRKKRETGQ